MSGEYGMSTLHEKCDLFLDSEANFICEFYFDMCKLLNVFPFVGMYEKFVPNVDYSPETFKTMKKPYLEYCSKKFKEELNMYMKTFLHILKRFLNEKYPNINFEFYLSRRTKNVRMGLNCGLLTLHGHDQVISDIKEIWLLKTRYKI